MPKTSLREFQARLAERLRAGAAGETPSRWLAVVAGGRHLLLPLEQAGEISPMQPPTPLPHARDWFGGIVNLRGQLCGLVYLGAFLGGTAAPQTPQARLIQFAADIDLNAALQVDQLAGLRGEDRLSPLQAEPDPATPWLHQRWRDEAGQDWQVLELRQLAEDPRFLQVA